MSAIKCQSHFRIFQFAFAIQSQKKKKKKKKKKKTAEDSAATFVYYVSSAFGITRDFIKGSDLVF